MIGGNTMLLFHKKMAVKTRLKGRADSNSVAFEASVQDGEKISQYQAHIAYTEDEKMVDKPFYGDINHAGIDFKIEKMLHRFSNYMFKITLAFLLVIIGLTFIPGEFEDLLYWLLVFLCGMVLLGEAIVINYARFKKDAEITQFLKYLAAMNSARNAYYKLGRVPSMKEVRRYSAFSSESKYLNKTNFFTYIFYVMLLNVIPDWKMMAISGALFLIFMVLEKKHMIYFWQRLIYSKPDNVHYYTALTALTECIEKTKADIAHAEE